MEIVILNYYLTSDFAYIYFKELMLLFLMEYFLVIKIFALIFTWAWYLFALIFRLICCFCKHIYQKQKNLILYLFAIFDYLANFLSLRIDQSLRAESQLRRPFIIL